MSVIEPIEHKEIEGVRVGRYGRRINTTNIFWRLGTLLIDTGPPNQWPFFHDFVQHRRVKQAIATHHHEDHAGNLSRLPGLGVTELYAPAESLDWIGSGFPLQAYRRIVWGRPGRIRVRPLPRVFETEAGDELEAILLPGHSPDMTCLLDRNRGVLFGADLYVGGRLRYLRRDENLCGIMSSLQRALTYDFDTLLCSHRGIVEPAKERLQAKLDFLEELRATARELRRSGRPLADITRQLLGREDFVGLASLGHFSKRNLIAACLSDDGSTCLTG